MPSLLTRVALISHTILSYPFSFITYWFDILCIRLHVKLNKSKDVLLILRKALEVKATITFASICDLNRLRVSNV